MRMLHVTHPSGFEHDTGPLHPERPARLRAAAAGVETAEIDVEAVEAEPIEPIDLRVVHDSDYIEAIRRFCLTGGGDLDADTPVSAGSWDAALAAAGAGPTAVARLESGFDGPAFISVRPPGHHALANRAMGFCLFNNIAVTAARLRDKGQRVAIVDWDVHHGNGTQAMFFHDPAVFYVSLHQWPFYPHEGAADEVGRAEGLGTTLNIPLPAYTGGGTYREAFREIVIPAVQAFSPDWLLVSAGFDAHADDPLAEMRLTETDYAFMTEAVAALVPANRLMMFLEGGYHLPAIRDSITAVVRSMVGESTDWPESPFDSPPEAGRAIARVRSAIDGWVVGFD